MKRFPAFAAVLTGAAFATALTASANSRPASMPAPLTKPSVDTAPHLDFVSIPGLTPIGSGTMRYDAGSIDVVRIAHWKHTFTLENTTRQSLTIISLRGSCGCETLLLTKGGSRVSQVQLAPGEKSDFLLDVQLAVNQAGPVRKYVWVYGPEVGSGQAAPLATLELDMALRQSVVFVPGRLDFGKVPSGAGAAQALTVTLDAGLISGRSLPPLTSADPSLQIVPSGDLQKTNVNGQAALRQSYDVKLSPSAPAGQMSSELRFQTPAGETGRDASLTRLSVSVFGVIAGALDAMPASVFFGSLPAGKPVTRTVVLSLASAQSVQSLGVSSSNSWLRATLDNAENSAKHHLLSVTLTDQAPPGSLQGKVTVALRSGERLEIPVIAELTK